VIENVRKRREARAKKRKPAPFSLFLNAQYILNAAFHWGSPFTPKDWLFAPFIFFDICVYISCASTTNTAKPLSYLLWINQIMLY
jgi:hypothetical protein